MKRLCFVVLLVAVMASGAFAATVGTWYGSSAGPPYTGSWADTYWNSARDLGPPAPPGNVGDEVKLTRDNTVCTVSTAVGNCNWSTSVGSAGSASARMEIVAGGSIGMKEMRIGAGGATGSTTVTGYLDHTGGTLNVYGDGDIYIGRQGNAAGKIGVGYYTISGGTIVCDATTTTKGGLYVGGASGTEGQIGSIGTFTVVGDDASITMKKLYVGAQTVTRYGTGTLEFKIDVSGVSPIRLTDASSIILDQAGANSTANLVVSLLAAPPSGVILLVENTNTGAVSGTFDTLNGGSAAEGASVVLGGNTYTLTYQGGVGGNDIVLIPEPATMVLLGLGSLIAIRRRRK